MWQLLSGRCQQPGFQHFDRQANRAARRVACFRPSLLEGCESVFLSIPVYHDEHRIRWLLIENGHYLLLESGDTEVLHLVGPKLTDCAAKFFDEPFYQYRYDLKVRRAFPDKDNPIEVHSVVASWASATFIQTSPLLKLSRHRSSSL